MRRSGPKRALVCSVKQELKAYCTNVTCHTQVIGADGVKDVKGLCDIESSFCQRFEMFQFEIDERVLLAWHVALSNEHEHDCALSRVLLNSCAGGLMAWEDAVMGVGASSCHSIKR